ncbi:M48 family metalloprotease [Ideonella sp.]|uniref:M48 family metalloprotease n=1 Tax=Ideonella sp. TaxID=1929293 RepID=UPI003BB5BC56
MASLCGLWHGTVAQAQVNLPALGDSVSSDFDLNDERKLGERIMRSIRQDPDFLDDPLLSEYLRGLWLPLLDAARQRGDIDASTDASFPWELFQVRDRSVNAFALPGGYVGVHLGLIAMTGSADELASVLAHELTHVTQRHIGRSMVNSQRQSMASVAAMVLGLIVASRAGTMDGANAVIMGSQAAMAQGQLNFSREMEREADRIGLQLLSTAGFVPAGMASMFEKMESNSRLNDSNQYPYLRSHPLTIERISEARLRTSNAGPGTRSPTPAEHGLMQARARVLMDNAEPTLRRLQTQAQPGSPAMDSNRLAALYAGALASLKLRDYPQAYQAIDAALTLAKARFGTEPRARRALLLLKLETQVAESRPTESLSAALAPLGGDTARPTLLARSQAALAWRRSGESAAAEPVLRQSVEALQTWVTLHKQDVLAWQALSQCAEALGLRLRALRSGAEAAAASGDVVGAVDRFRIAQQIAREDANADYVEASIIQSRLRELEAERRKLMAEMRNGG